MKDIRLFSVEGGGGVTLDEEPHPLYNHDRSLLSDTAVKPFVFDFWQGPKVPVKPLGVKASIYGVNGSPLGEGEPVEACAGITHEWTVVNNSTTLHPFHLHANHFQVTSYECYTPGPCENDDYEVGDWRDSIAVPSPGEVKVRFRADGWEGETMAHCHIIGHQDRGMAVGVKMGGYCK